jgi:hypothetical protein
MRRAAMIAPREPRAMMQEPDAAQIAMTLGGLFSARTTRAIEAAPAQLRAPMILGSPEFMMR